MTDKLVRAIASPAVGQKLVLEDERQTVSIRRCLAIPLVGLVPNVATSIMPPSN